LRGQAARTFIPASCAHPVFPHEALVAPAATPH
jgi:hypothetical protein